MSRYLYVPGYLTYYETLGREGYDFGAEVNDFARADFSICKNGASDSPSPTLGMWPVCSSRRKPVNMTGRKHDEGNWADGSRVTNCLTTGAASGCLIADRVNDRKPLSCRTRTQRRRRG